MQGNDGIVVDACVTVLGKCPMEYSISGNQAEFHFGNALDGFHFAFDAAALRKLLSLGNEALTELEPTCAGVQAT